MRTSRIAFGVAAVMALSMPSYFALAAARGGQSEAAYLNAFEGKWSGSGAVRLAPGTPMLSLDCTMSGTAGATRLNISGSCGKGLIGSQVAAQLDFDARSNTYSGTWRNASQTAALSGVRRGNNLSLKVVEADKPDRRMSLAVNDGKLVLVINRVDDQAKVLELGLDRT